ncbi:MAG: PH domain-containing protein [Candidatus Aenigmatarchaeota archaeon]
MPTIDYLLDPGEKVIWRGKPKFWPFVWPSLIIIPFGVIFMAIPIAMAFLAGFGVYLFIIPHFWIGVIMVVGAPLYSMLVHKHVEYAITDKRVMVQKGLIGRDFNTIDYEKIQDVSVNVGIIDKIFNCGTIISTSAGYLRNYQGGAHGNTFSVPGNLFKSIPEPYEVYKLLKKVVLDVKTDINYPNKYRPDTNPGYGTKYRGKESRRSRDDMSAPRRPRRY